ncbi:MAG: deoxyribonuclease IV [Gemmatimonadota bacterium]
MSAAPVGASMESSADAPTRDELGAHVSAAGGVHLCPQRALDIDSVNLQLFTKQPSRWADPEVDDTLAHAYRSARMEAGLEAHGAHDSYLINLSTPNPKLWERSYACFRSELIRCARLELGFLVTHPGNATDGDEASGLARNAEGVTRALEEVEGPTRVLLELTAGSGTTVGATLENLRTILDGIPTTLRSRVGICFDTCHALAAGYDLVDDYDGVWAQVDDVLGLDRVGLFHLNDSKHPLGSRKDRHEEIGKGYLGEEPFRRIMADSRFQEVPKVLETPKGDDMVVNDRRALQLLRSYRQAGVK